MANPTALITGASTGIGRELARCFAADGHDVILVARNRGKLQELADELTRQFVIEARVMPFDLARPQSPDELLGALSGRDIDVLVNNAGFGAGGEFAELDERMQAEMIQVNVMALVRLTRLLLPSMLQRRRGKILNIASTAAFQAGPRMAVYYATKAFVLSFSEALAAETAGRGITVTALCPGPTRTEFQQRAALGKSFLFAGKLVPLMNAAEVAEIGYRACKRGRRIVVPGFRNKLGVLVSRLLPRRTLASIAMSLNRGKYG